MIQTNVQQAIEAIKDAQDWYDMAQKDVSMINRAHEQINYAEQLLEDVQLEPQNIEDRYQLQQATDLLRILKESFDTEI